MKCPTCGKEQPKSSVQRNMFHQICRTIGKELGYEPAFIKAAIKQDFFGLDEQKIGNKWYRITKGSEEAGRVEYSELIDFSLFWAEDKGVII